MTAGMNTGPATVVRKIIGSGNPDHFKVKAVVPVDRSKTWHVFACRMDPSTKATDVKDQLTAGGILVVACTQLRRTEKWQEKYSAFRVVVDIEDKDTIFNETLWPVGVDVRDWWFKSQ